MKYLHVMPPSQRMLLTYVEMLRDSFPIEDHIIMLNSPLSKNDGGLLLFDNVIPFEKLGNNKIERFLNIEKYLKEADRIVFHSFMPTRIWTSVLLKNMSFLDKSIWVIWGIDLYNYVRNNNSIHNRIMNKIGFTFRSRMKYPVVVSEPDIEEYNKRFGTHEVRYAPYAFSNERFRTMDISLKTKNIEEENDEDSIYEEGTFNIQVCHNAYSFNNHFEIIKDLEPLCHSHDDIKLYFPLSYGDSLLVKNVSYVNSLKSYIMQKVSGNSVIIDKIMTNNNYTKHLSKMDVAIFNAARHNGLGNILQLLYMGKKVYLSNQSPLLPYLREKGFVVHDTNELKNITYDDLVKKDKTKNYKKEIKDMFGVETMKKLWIDIFNEC